MKRRFRILILLCIALVGGCYLRDVRWNPVRPPGNTPPREFRLEVTGYCDCAQCCGWKRNWFGMPVHRSGPLRGKRKKVGVTASGQPAQQGTIAADTSVFPFGTILYVPGYGYGVVEDRGGDIKGYHIDLYFSTHRQAQEWGRQRLRTKVWMK